MPPISIMDAKKLDFFRNVLGPVPERVFGQAQWKVGFLPADL